MKMYRITFYDGWGVWAAQIGREYQYFESEDKAREYALSRVLGSQWGFQVVAVAQSEIPFKE